MAAQIRVTLIPDTLFVLREELNSKSKRQTYSFVSPPCHCGPLHLHGTGEGRGGERRGERRREEGTGEGSGGYRRGPPRVRQRREPGLPTPEECHMEALEPPAESVRKVYRSCGGTAIKVHIEITRRGG